MPCVANLVVAAACPLCYVGLVLAFDYNGQNRNIASSVKKRLVAAVLTSAISVTITYRQLDGNLNAMGLRTTGMVKAALLPSTLILVLYFGQILLLFFDGQLKSYLGKH